MAKDIGYNYYKFTVNGQEYVEPLPTGGVTPQGAGHQEISYDEFIKKAKTPRSNMSFGGFNNQYDFWKNAGGDSAKALEPGAQSGYQMVDKVLTTTKSIEDTAMHEAAVAAGKERKVPIGGGFGYIPIGSEADKTYSRLPGASSEGTVTEKTTPPRAVASEMTGTPTGTTTPPSAVVSKTIGTPSGNAPVPGSTLFPRIPGAVAPTAPTAPSEEDIRKAKVERAQATVNAVNAAFNRVISGEQEAGKGREARTRALNISAGLGGSDFASAAAIETEKGTQKNVAALEEERANKIATILADVEERATTEFLQKKQLFNVDREDYQRQLEAYQAKGLESVAALAKAGVNLTALKTQEPETYKELMKQTGKSELEVDSYFVSQIPQASIIDKVQVGNKYIILSKNPDGTIKKDTIDLPAEVVKDESTFTIAPDGTPIIFNKTTGTATIAKGFTSGQFGKPEPAKKVESQVVNSGGKSLLINSETGETIKDLGPADPKVETEVVEVGGRKILINSKTGATIKDLGAKDGGAPSAITDQQNAIRAENKLAEIDAVLGASDEVYSDIVGNLPGAFIRPFGAGANAETLSKIETLLSGLTLDELIAAKARGATFGALSDAELKTLAAAASNLGARAVKRDDGSIKGFRGTVAGLKADIGKIRELAALDAERWKTKGAGTAGAGKTVRLKDPTTGEVREFTNLSDADLKQALSAGYLQQ